MKEACCAMQSSIDQLRCQRLVPFQNLAYLLLDHLYGIFNYCRTKVPLERWGPSTVTSKLFFEEVAAVGIYEFLCRAVLSLPCVSAYALETIQGNRVDVAKIDVRIISGAKHMPIPDRAVNDCCLFQPTNLVP